MAETKVDMNELSKKICEDVGGELKAVVKPCPSTFIKVYKAYYNKATFASCCAFDGPPKLELMQNAFAVHCYYVFSIFVFTVILRAVVLGKYGLSPIQEFDLINFILLFFAFVWVLTITKYNESCCLNRFVNTAIFTAIMAWFALGAFLSALNCFQVMEWSSVFIIPAIINFCDMTVIIPLVHWSLHATMYYKAEGDAVYKVGPDDPVKPAAAAPDASFASTSTSATGASNA